MHDLHDFRLGEHDKKTQQGEYIGHDYVGIVFSVGICGEEDRDADDPLEGEEGLHLP